MSGHRHRRGCGQIQTLAGQRADGGHLRQQDAGGRDGDRGQLALAGHRVTGSERAHPAQRLEADRANDHELAGDRLEQQLGLADQGAQLGLDAGQVDQFLEALEPGTTLTAEDHGVRFAGIEQVHQGLG